MKIIIFICTSFLVFTAAIAQIPKARTGTYALINADIHTVTNGVLNSGMLVIRDGKIVAVSEDIELPEDASVIDCSGLQIYPGLIDAGTRLGLSEVGSDPRTQDYNEIGQVIPHMQALTAVNPNSALIPVTRVNGVTTVLSVPSGGLFPGTAALINLHGYTPQQMYAGFSGVVMNFPTSGSRGWWDKRSKEEIKKASEKAFKELNDVWEKVEQYHKTDSAIAAGNTEVELGYYPEMAALLPVYRKEQKILIEVDRAGDIKAAIKWVQERDIDAIFTGVEEGWRVAEELAAANIPVITGPVLKTPGREYDKYDKPYANAGLMANAGVKVALRTMEAENVRNLPYNAGFAATYGMGREEALRAVTIIPAEILGVDDQLGSLEVGKNATFFATNGDPFETSTQVKTLFINGWWIPLVSRQTQLYDEFLEREPGLRN